MPQQSTLSGAWRAFAALLSLAWLGSVLAMLVITIGGSGHRLAGVAMIFMLLASLVVLALLRNLGKVISGELTEPGDWEVKLATVAVLLLAAGWALYFFS